VDGAKGGGGGKGKYNELRRWSVSRRRKERWRGVEREVRRKRAKQSGHTAAEADMMAGVVLVDAICRAEADHWWLRERNMRERASHLSSLNSSRGTRLAPLSPETTLKAPEI